MRRAFLRGLTSLPLIGGGVTLIGNPTAAAVPVTGGTALTYLAWLDFERRYVSWALGVGGAVPMLNPGAAFHCTERNVHAGGVHAIERGPIILAAAGCPLTCPEAEEQASELGLACWRERVPLIPVYRT